MPTTFPFFQTIKPEKQADCPMTPHCSSTLPLFPEVNELEADWMAHGPTELEDH